MDSVSHNYGQVNSMRAKKYFGGCWRCCQVFVTSQSASATSCSN